MVLRNWEIVEEKGEECKFSSITGTSPRTRLHSEL
jgi:hypothetical protein